MSVRWRRADDGFVESHCGRWWITPIYAGRTRPEAFRLRELVDGQWKERGEYMNQRDAKECAR